MNVHAVIQPIALKIISKIVRKPFDSHYPEKLKP